MIVTIQPGWPESPFKIIYLQNDFICKVDPEWFGILATKHWYAKQSLCKYYACRKVVEDGITWFERMHRVVAATQPGMVCHHINNNSLDNRRANLRNMTYFEHAKLYSYW